MGFNSGFKGLTVPWTEKVSEPLL